MVIDRNSDQRPTDFPGRFKAVAFDFDGLLFNTEELYQEVGEAILARRGRSLCKGLLAVMRGKPNWTALQAMIDWHGLADSIDQLLWETDMLFEPLLATRLKPMAGATELLDCLGRAGIPRAVVTSGRRGFVMPILARYGWVERFAFVLTAEDIVFGKPHPEPYLEAARRFGVPPQRVLVLEDSHHGCVAGREAGSGVVCVPNGREAAHPDGILFVAASLDDRRIVDLLGIALRHEAA